jgi:hypothetical protein
MGVLGAATGALPLDSLVTLTAEVQDPTETPNKQFWVRHSPKWPLLRRVRLASNAGRIFGEMLLKDNGGRESPLFPSLTELVLSLFDSRTLRLLCNALMKRVEQGVPLETLDLRTCAWNRPAEVRPLSEIVVNVLLGPESAETMIRMRSMWYAVGLGLFVEEDNYGEGDDYDSHIGTTGRWKISLL